MGNLKFKDFVWPHNPTSFNMSYDKRLIRHEYPEIDCAEHEDLGMNPRTFSGSGVFYGPGAWAQFSVLSTYYYKRDAGILIHPQYGQFRVRLSKLSSKEEPLPEYVEYDYEFVEDYEINTVSVIRATAAVPPASPPARYHTVVRGDTLWDISKKYYGTGTKWPTIANANKSKIRDPHWIYPGQVFLIP